MRVLLLCQDICNKNKEADYKVIPPNMQLKTIENRERCRKQTKTIFETSAGNYRIETCPLSFGYIQSKNQCLVLLKFGACNATAHRSHSIQCIKYEHEQSNSSTCCVLWPKWNNHIIVILVLAAKIFVCVCASLCHVNRHEMTQLAQSSCVLFLVRNNLVNATLPK